jgi:nucleotide-binding universal stress UspA family protein
MSYKTILVRVECDPARDDAIRLAKTVAGMFDAALLGVGAEAFDIAAYGYAEGDLMAALRDQVDVDLASAEQGFLAQTKGWPAGAQWVSSPEYPLDVMAREAHGADLVVACRPPSHAGASYSCSPADLLMATGLPLLLAADGRAELQAKRVVVAWRDRRESVRAVSDALPFLARAESVHLVNVSRPGEREAAQAGLETVKQRLARHGIVAQTELVEPACRSVTGDLEAAADRYDADLIVAGAYSHNRLREWVLGGVTQELVAGSKKFILFSR